MTFKKLLALVSALAVASAALCSCSGEKKESPASSGDVTLDSPSDIGAAESEAGGESGEGLLYIDGEEIDTDGLIMMTANGVEVPFDEYRYMYNSVDTSYFSGGDPTFWDTYPDALAELKEYTEYFILQNIWGKMLAPQYGIELDEEDEAEVDGYVEEQRAAFGSEEAFQEALEVSKIDEDLLRRMYEEQVLDQKVYDELYGNEGAPLAPPDEEIKDALENDYVRVYHVLVSNDHFADQEGYEDATDEELKAAALDYAKELLEQIKNGADIYELAQSADDPGMIDNPTGYFFTDGTMVDEFQEASYALEVGELSDIVETSYGYHIIQRLEQEDFIEENWEALRGEYVTIAFTEDIQELVDNAEIEYCEYYDKLTPDSIR